MSTFTKHVGVGAVLAAALMSTGSAMAGGFAVREQSTYGQGMSFAGSAAYSSISAMFWNSAAAANQTGLNAESGAAYIIPKAELTALPGVTSGGIPANTGTDTTVDIGTDAIVPSTYLTYQFKNFDPRLYIGLGLNSGFGLKTEPENRWAGSQVAGATSLFTLNVNPMLAYKLSDTIAVGVGAQVQYAKGILKFATGSNTGVNSYFEGDDLAVGGTAGIMFTPNPGTRIGLGYRSQITHKLDGVQATNFNPAFGLLATPLENGVGTEVELKLPDIVTLSFSQAVAPNARVLGTVEWSNWSRLESLDLVTTGAGNTVLARSVANPTGAVTAGRQIGSISTKWEDGWFFSGGFEYDVNPLLTVRAGGAYEISPVTKATERVASIPDADRIWASFGFSYAMNKSTTIDFGYTHLFVDDARIDRENVSRTTGLIADLDASLDIISLGVRMKLGE